MKQKIKDIMKRLRNRRGTSFLEVMISLAIMGVITTAILQLYVAQHKSYLAQDDVAIIQQNARASIDELSRHIRMAGNQLPFGIDAISAANTNPDTITITYRTEQCDTYLSAPMPNPSAELKCGSDISCFYDGQWVYIFEPDSGGGEWFEITEVQAPAFHIQHNTMTLSRAYGADAILLSMVQIKFFIDSTDASHPNLMLQLPGSTPQVFAEDITDLQFQYRLKNGVVVDVPVLAEDIREVLISLTGRSAHENYEMAPQYSDGDHDDEEDEGHYRRRVYSTSVFLRNVGI